MVHELPKLEYEYDSLEPYLDKETMEIHYSKHHQGYVNKLNKALEKYPELQEYTPKQLLVNLPNISEEIRTAIKNNAGGHFNHTFFWTILKKDSSISGKEIETEIINKFGSLPDFKTHFNSKASTLFGSGWTWLVLNNNELEILNTKNQDSPISENKIPLIALDIWEHAYYLKYQNKRPEYIEAFFNLINWEKVNEIFLKNKQ